MSFCLFKKIILTSESMFFKENKTLSPYFGVSKRSKNYFCRRKKKEDQRKNSQLKNYVPFFAIIAVFIKKISLKISFFIILYISTYVKFEPY